MKRPILFALLCTGMLFIGAIVYAGLVQSDTTAMLSDREMALITGACCYEVKHIDCRVYGDIMCNATGLCIPTTTEKFHNPYRFTCTTGAVNNKKCSCGTVACFTPYYVQDLGLIGGYICRTSPPPGADPAEWAGYYFWCDNAAATCRRCGWGAPAGGAILKWDCDCVPA